MILKIFSLVLLCTVRTALASDARAFYNYLKEIAEPEQAVEGAAANGREGRQSIPLSIFSLNGFANFTYNVASIPTNYPIACGGDDRNYCNYPDLPLIETYDLNYFSRRPIPSGRCPDGYTKSPTFDCLNIAPAFFETTCCVYLGTTTPSTNDVCTGSIDAAWTLCNGTVYIASGAYVWLYDVSSTGAMTLRAGPIALSAISGGCVTRDLSEATVNGNCDVVFFNLNDQYYTTSYRTSSISCSGPNLNTNLGVGGTPNQAFRVGGSTTIYHLDGDGFVVGLPLGYLFNCGSNTTSGISITPPGVIGTSPYINCSAVTYVSSLDILVYFCGSTIYRVTRTGVLSSTSTLTSVLSNCGSTTTTTSSGSSAVAPVVYIPYPIYPVFMGSNSPGGSTPGGSYTPGTSYSSPSSPSSYSYSPSPSPMSPSPSPSSSYSYSPSPSPGTSYSG
ncbi:uncharacterized protein LOC129587333 [Paramacrobiotus metropolitanus]|uniref:uncharacterized protein LOC129587333 n=1 Tax=Paramacrobiotus metropolitanus TaxID=2943436 RepID=UPI0024462EA4|nr:uncharacterized protein LOC129587333 [Paramacrobiotus metropolitanus]